MTIYSNSTVFLNVSTSKLSSKNPSPSFRFSPSEATVGDNGTEKPGMFDLKGKYKWEAWNNNKGKGKDAAQKEYIALVRELQSKQ